jgi:hypothetical protein
MLGCFRRLISNAQPPAKTRTSVSSKNRFSIMFCNALTDYGCIRIYEFVICISVNICNL